jgi:hypothetical protein
VGQAGAVEPTQEFSKRIDQLEARITMPVGARDLHAYTRYYAQTGGLLDAVFIAGVDEVRIVSLDQLPQIFDGGCDVVHAKYDLATGHIQSIFCNGRG